MQKYNQGFGRFGPMEKCDGGKWVRAEDAEKRIEAVRSGWRDAWKGTFDRARHVSWKRDVSAAIAVLGWTIITVALVKYAFTGNIL